MPHRHPLHDMAALVRSRQLSSLQLVDAHLAQIEHVNPSINAFTRVFADQARQAARNADASEPRGLLHGVPVTVKDSLDVAGVPTLCGSRLRSGHVAAEDSVCVRRLKAHGAILIGKTNTPELLHNYETDNAITGRTNNPWDLERTPGGSSGGEAAAIAARCSPGGVGSDGGGSVRVPAHFCGICGLKPTPGRIPATGHFPECLHPGGLLGVVGPMARTARDLVLLFHVLAGHDPSDPFSVPMPLGAPARRPCRIGLLEQFPRVPVHGAVSDAIARAAALLETLGHRVEPLQPVGLERAPNLWAFFFDRMTLGPIRKLVAGRESELHWTLSEFLAACRDQPEPTCEEILAAFTERDTLRAQLLQSWQDFDAVLLPVTAVPAFPHRQRRYDTGARSIGLFQANMTVQFLNLFGLPGVAVPMTLSPDKVPVGIQLAGKPWEDELILDLAVQLEEARGPFPSALAAG